MPKKAKKQVVLIQYVDPSHFCGDHSIPKPLAATSLKSLCMGFMYDVC